MRGADLFEGSINPLLPSRSLNLIPHSAVSINRIIAAICFQFPGFVQTSILPTFGEGYLFAGNETKGQGADIFVDPDC